MSKYLFNHEHNTHDLREYLAANPDERLTYTLNSLDIVNVQRLKAESERDALTISNSTLAQRLSEVQGEMDKLRERASQVMHRVELANGDDSILERSHISLNARLMADRRSFVLDKSHENASDDGSSDEDLTATSDLRNKQLAAKTIITELSHELEASRRREVDAEHDHADHVAHLEDELTFRDEQLLDLEQRFRQLMVISEKDAKTMSPVENPSGNSPTDDEFQSDTFAHRLKSLKSPLEINGFIPLLLPQTSNQGDDASQSSAAENIERLISGMQQAAEEEIKLCEERWARKVNEVEITNQSLREDLEGERSRLDRKNVETASLLSAYREAEQLAQTNSLLLEEEQKRVGLLEKMLLSAYDSMDRMVERVKDVDVL